MQAAGPKALIVVLLGAFLFLAYRNPPTVPVLVLEGRTMGTSWSVQLTDVPGMQPNEGLADRIQTLLSHLDKGIFSTWSPDSELSRFNAAATGQAHAISAHLMAVLGAAQSVHTASLGAFDPTVGPLVELWGFGPTGSGANPGPAEIHAAQARLGMQHLVLDAATGSAMKRADIALDLSGIAKGYAVDQIAELLQSEGFPSFLVEIGGEIRLQGAGPDGAGWRVAIESPAGGTRTVFASIESKGRSLALAGSGDYRNFRLVDGQRLSHEIDPRSGRPVVHELAAVNTVADTAMLADAWATALMVLGPDEGARLADGLRIAAYFIIRGDTDFVGYRTDSMSFHLDAAEGERVPL